MNRPTSCHFARAHTHAYTYIRTHAHPNMRKARTKRNPPVCLSPSELVDLTLLRTESKHVHMRTNISCSQDDESALSVSALEPDRRGRTPHPMLPYSHTNVCVNPIPSHSITSLLTTDTMSTDTSSHYATHIPWNGQTHPTHRCLPTAITYSTHISRHNKPTQPHTST